MLDEILKREYGRIVGLDLSWEATGWALQDCHFPGLQFGALAAVGGSATVRLKKAATYPQYRRVLQEVFRHRLPKLSE
jgi:hypothetical protein